MNIKNLLDNFTSIIMDPSKGNREPLAQGFAWLTTIILGIGTIGIVQGVSALWRRLRHVERNETHEKIARLFQSSHAFPLSRDPSGVYPTRDAQSKQVKTDASLLSRVANEVYAKRDTLWREARTEAEGDGRQIAAFINKIRGCFRTHELSLSHVIKDNDALNTFFKSRRLRTALVVYARANNLDGILDAHLAFVAQHIYENKHELYQQVAGRYKDDIPTQIIVLTIRIAEIFRSEGRSIREVFESDKAREIFTKSNTLMMVLLCYASRQNGSHQRPGGGEGHDRFENHQQRDARRLGEEMGRGQGLVTALGLNEFQSDEKKLQKAVKQFLLKNHPDKNPNADQEAVRLATNLLGMLRDGVYDTYKRALEEQR